MAKSISYQILKQRRLVVNKEKRGGIGVFPENKNDREENISQRRRKPDERRKEARERHTRTLRDDLFAIKKNYDTSIQGKNRESNQRRKYGKQIGVPLTQPNWIGHC